MCGLLGSMADGARTVWTLWNWAELPSCPEPGWGNPEPPSLQGDTSPLALPRALAAGRQFTGVVATAALRMPALCSWTLRTLKGFGFLCTNLSVRAGSCGVRLTLGH